MIGSQRSQLLLQPLLFLQMAQAFLQGFDRRGLADGLGHSLLLGFQLLLGMRTDSHQIR